jgi:two-component system, NtrC family, C4-dicarboxylate transport sensor histidine kinase DctB
MGSATARSSKDKTRRPAAWLSKRWLAISTGALAVLAILAIASAVAGRVASDRAIANLVGQARAGLPLAAATLAGEIEKQRLIPLTLARDPDVIALLETYNSNAEANLDRKLKDIAEDAGSTVIYVIGADGRTVATSNFSEPDSFAGAEFQFRYYFRDAIIKGVGMQYSLGALSARPGLFLSRRVEGSNVPLGVVVVKVELNSVEATWRASGAVVSVTNDEGVIIATTIPDWRFSTLSALSEPGLALAREHLQVVDPPLSPAPLRQEGDDLTIAQIDGQPVVLAGISQAVGASAPGWRLMLLLHADTAITRARLEGQITAVLAFSLIIALGRITWRRRQLQAARRAALTQMNTELEARVEERTDQLKRTNLALATEMAEREIAETKVQRLRDELAQANRLSILGQIAAGVAHEMNQPLAAIGVYAHNAKCYIEADKVSSAADSLGQIVALTEQIGSKTEALRSFSRRAPSAATLLTVDDAIDGALSLLSGRIREASVSVIRPGRDRALCVMASRIRVEQILVNLLQNALDALQSQPHPRIEVGHAPSAETVQIWVRDNGPGLDPAIRATLFMPFATSKEKGLGLGLVISSEIARELGGHLELTPSDEGACFTLTLPRAYR